MSTNCRLSELLIPTRGSPQPIMWHSEKHTLVCFHTRPSPDKRRRNSRRIQASCWSPSTLGVSLSVIIFHACHVDQIERACVLFIRPPAWGEGGKCVHICTRVGSDLFPPGWCGQIKKNKNNSQSLKKNYRHIHFSTNLIWVWTELTVINCNLQRGE